MVQAQALSLPKAQSIRFVSARLARHPDFSSTTSHDYYNVYATTHGATIIMTLFATTSEGKHVDFPKSVRRNIALSTIRVNDVI